MGKLMNVRNRLYTYRELKHLSKRMKHIKTIPNPVRRGLRYSAVALTEPILLTCTLTLDTAEVVLEAAFFLIVSPVLVGTVLIPYIDRWIDRFDEYPGVNVAPSPVTNSNVEPVYFRINSNNPSNSNNSSEPDDPIINSHVTVLTRLNKTDELNHYSQYTRNYIESFNQTIPYSLQIEKLQLNEEEQLKLEPYLDPVTNNFIDIPVRLNEKLYDLSTLIICFHSNKMDPYNKIPFELRDIAPAREINEKIKELIASMNHEKTNEVENTKTLEIDSDNRMKGMSL